ncbi:MAG: transcription elongation factor GreA [Lachnospiraceae bacterium]|nr:transcription elongation factor GreA [Lachnospiraceae bacterium]
MAEEKKNLLTREGLEKYEEELHFLKVTKREEIAQKLKEARAQGDLSENAEYDAAKDEQRNVEARIEELEKLLKNVEVVDNDGTDDKKVKFGSTVKIQDKETKEELIYRIVGASEAKCLEGSISDESPLGRALIGAKKNETISVDAPCGVLKYKVLEIVKEKSTKK